MTMKARLARLETLDEGAARVIVIAGPKGLNVERELRDQAITAAQRDLVVVIAKPEASPIGTTVYGKLGASRSILNSARPVHLP
jgi:hypothetical protein